MPESTTITCPRLTSILFHSSPAQAVCATSLERADFKVQVILKTVDFWSRQLQGRGVQPAVLLFTRTNVKAVLQHLQCHKAVIRDRRLMPTGIGGFLVPCSEGWPGRVKFISVQKPRILSEHYWIPVPRLSVALQQCSGSWPALCTLGIAPKGAERQEAGGFITSFLLCVMATLFCSCAMRIAEVLHFFFYILFQVRFFCLLVHSPGGEKVQPARCDSPVCFGCSAELNGIGYWRNALFSENQQFLQWKHTPFFPTWPSRQAHKWGPRNQNSEHGVKNHKSRSIVPCQLGLPHPSERGKAAETKMQENQWCLVGAV